MSITYNGKSVLAIYRNGTAVEQALIAWNWTPRQLYFGGVRGAAYVPDTGEVYGLNGLAAFGENISAVLDEKNGTPVLSPNLISNGDFANGITGWATGDPAAATIAVIGGRLQLIPKDNLTRSAYQLVTTVAGKTYEISLTYDSGTATSIVFFAGSVFGSSNLHPNTFRTGAGTTKSSFVATSTTTWLVFGPSANNLGKEAFFDDISVREFSGNPSIQNSISPRPLFGRAPALRRNMLTWSESFGNADWTKTGATISATLYTAPNGELSANAIVPTGTGFNVQRSFATNITGTYTTSISVKDNGAGSCMVAMGSNTVGYLINVNLTTGAFISGRSYGGGTLVGYTINSQGNGWWRVAVTVTAILASSMVAAADGTSPTSGILVWGAQLETGSVATAYQKVTTALDMTESGVTSYPFIRMDLSDDALTTSGLGSTKNLIKYTEEFDNVTWTKENSIVVQSNMAIAPDGTMSADKLLEKAATQQHRFYQGVPSLTVPRVFSVYLKQAERTWAYLEFANGAFAFFNLATGEAGAIGGTGITSSISAASNGFYRCEIRTSGTYGVECRIAVTTGNSVFSYLGDGTSGIFVWGAQFEAGSVATAYEYGGFKGTALVSGRSGSTFSDVTLPDGNFSLGPTTYTSGTANILRPIGDIVGYNLINKTLTAKERKYLIEYYKDRGAKGLLVPGPELLINRDFASNTAGWFFDGGATIASGVGVFTNDGTSQRLRQDILTIGKTYQITLTVSSYVTGTIAIQTGSNILNLPSANGTYTVLSFANTPLFGIRNGMTGILNVDDVSVKELGPEEEWV